MTDGERSRNSRPSGVAASIRSFALRAIGVDHGVVTVTDVERTTAWWRDLLGAQIERLDEWRAGTAAFVSARLSPTTIIDLIDGDRSGANVDHVAVLIEGADLAALAVNGGFEVETGPHELSGAQGMGQGLYVLDPDGNRIELRTYPARS